MGKNDLFQQGLLQQKEGLPAFICLIISVQLPVNLMVFVPLPMGALVTHCQSKQFGNGGAVLIELLVQHSP